MTEEQIEQKAEEYAENFKSLNIDLFNDVKQAYIDCCHECQKEHEWHYVKDRDLPKLNTPVLCCDFNSDLFVAFYGMYAGKQQFRTESGEVDVYAWQKLPYLPKEIE